MSSEAEPTRLEEPRSCSIADALDLVGDRWSLLVLRELGFGVRRFSDICQNTGAPRETLSARLRKLEDAGVISRRQYSEHPPRDEYLLTEAGHALTPVLLSLRNWGERYATPRVHEQP
jgi:DNA-binding HxlR family transcriptional regulator